MKTGKFTLEYSSKINSLLAISFIGYQTQYIWNIDNKGNQSNFVESKKYKRSILKTNSQEKQNYNF
jgi:hypothetical protein